jgi:wyosine [tRNA(Phe)-imidazoG37] synthetase (radical SAM superfamily)
MNCVYCECGPTTLLTTRRLEYVPYDEIVAELDAYLPSGPALDVVTFGGSGEPTLHSRLGAIIAHVKGQFPRYKTALLTNATLLHFPEVQEEIAPVDYVLPSLDAVSDAVFGALNRPAAGVASREIVDGLVSFSQRYAGKLMPEVFIVPGMNDTPEELALLKAALGKMKCNTVHLNTLDRPGSCPWVKPASAERLREIADFFAPLPTEIISRNTHRSRRTAAPGGDIDDTVLGALKRRPSTAEDISSMTGLNVDEVHTVLKRLLRDRTIVAETAPGGVFYRCPGNASQG